MGRGIGDAGLLEQTGRDWRSLPPLETALASRFSIRRNPGNCRPGKSKSPKLPTARISTPYGPLRVKRDANHAPERRRGAPDPPW